MLGVGTTYMLLHRSISFLLSWAASVRSIQLSNQLNSGQGSNEKELAAAAGVQDGRHDGLGFIKYTYANAALSAAGPILIAQGADDFIV